eukprot:SAG31_NODE_149_length_22476_cov_41.827189_7_plen_1249_part_00
MGVGSVSIGVAVVCSLVLAGIIVCTAAGCVCCQREHARSLQPVKISPGKGLLSRFCATIREIRYFNREKYGTNRESVCINTDAEKTEQAASQIERLFKKKGRKRRVIQGCSIGCLMVAQMFIPLGFFLGIKPLIPAIHSVIQSPSKASAMATDATAVARSLILLGHEAVDELEALNQSVTTYLRPIPVSTASQCVGQLLNNIPTTHLIERELTTAKTGITSLNSEHASAIRGYAMLNTTLNGLLPTAIERLSTFATAVGDLDSRQVLTGLRSEVRLHLSELGGGINYAHRQVDALVTELVQFAPFKRDFPTDNSDSDLQSMANDIQQYRSGTASYSGTTTTRSRDRDRLIGLVVAVRNRLDALHSLAQGTTTQISTYTVARNAVDMAPMVRYMQDVELALQAVPNVTTAISDKLREIGAVTHGFDYPRTAAALAAAKTAVNRSLQPEAIDAAAASVETGLNYLTCSSNLSYDLQLIDQAVIPLSSSVLEPARILSRVANDTRGIDLWRIDLGPVVRRIQSKLTVLQRLNLHLYESELEQVRLKLVELPDLAMLGETIELRAANLRAVQLWKETIDDLVAAVEHSNTTVPSDLASEIDGVANVAGSFRDRLTEFGDRLTNWAANGAPNSQAPAIPDGLTLADLQNLPLSIAVGLDGGVSTAAALASFRELPMPDESSMLLDIDRAQTNDTGTNVPAGSYEYGARQALADVANAFASGVEVQFLLDSWPNTSSVTQEIFLLDAGMQTAAALTAAFHTVAEIGDEELRLFSTNVAEAARVCAVLGNRAAINRARRILRSMSDKIDAAERRLFLTHYFSEETSTNASQVGDGLLEQIADCDTAACYSDQVAVFEQHFFEFLVAIFGHFVRVNRAPLRLPEPDARSGLSLQLVFGVVYSIASVAILLGVLGLLYRIEMLRLLSSWTLVLVLPILLLVATLLTPWVVAVTDLCGGMPVSAINWALREQHMGFADPLLLAQERDIRTAAQAIFAPYDGAPCDAAICFLPSDVKALELGSIARTLHRQLGDECASAESTQTTVSTVDGHTSTYALPAKRDAVHLLTAQLAPIAADLSAQLVATATEKLTILASADVELREAVGGPLSRIRAAGGRRFKAAAAAGATKLSCSRGRDVQLEVLSAVCCDVQSALTMTWAGALLVSGFAALGMMVHQLGRGSLRQQGGEPCNCGCLCCGGGKCTVDLGIVRTCRRAVAWTKKKREDIRGPPRGHDATQSWRAQLDARTRPTEAFTRVGV